MAKKNKKAQSVQKEWEDKLFRAKKVRKNWKDKFQVDLALAYFEGQQNPGVPESEWITINKVYSHLKSQLPTLYSADPYFYVKLRRSFKPDEGSIQKYEAMGKVRQSYLNYLKDELKMKQKVRMSIQDAFFAYGVVKSEYCADLVKNDEYGTDTETGELESIPINERYKITRIHPDDFLWDEDAGPLDDSWNWIAERVRITLAEAKKDPRFSKAAIRALKENSTSKDDDDKKREDRKKGEASIDSDGKSYFGESKDADQPVVYWNIFNLKTGQWLCISEGGEIPLVMPEKVPPGVEDHSYAILRFTMRDDSPYPIPPMSQGIDPQKEYNLARSDVIKHRKRFNRKYFATGPWGDTDISKLESGDDGAVIFGEMGATLEPIKDAPMDQMRYMEINLLNNDMVEMFGGTSDQARGIASADSATEAGILDKRLEVKEGDAMSMVIDFVRDIARKIDQLVKAHITRDEAVRISGPEGESWQTIRAEAYEDIDGEFEYTVNVGATMPRTPQMERASWMAFIGALTSSPIGAALSQAPHFMKKMAEMHHIEDELMIKELQQTLAPFANPQAPSNGSGSQPGVPENRPVSAIGGQAGGPMSMMLPGGGNLEG